MKKALAALPLSYPKERLTGIPVGQSFSGLSAAMKAK